ncbi:Rossmann-fold NAD(P)-binding domain-containing protein [Sphingomonas immobilis]|uniref:NAD(P)-dependent oxidoreductase n=1 Tax=Sphingomonas immobilis TaxID=3063997 RepID=A0ABT8ZXU1_9SPHN|nr:NAD(P)-dependent oxidoreductase [Sphingomonas sp. CA1-15]MDO7841297.1 NAD(P)-dependent oxidoreductase [Sphingomonas sp. CA1-15]
MKLFVFGLGYTAQRLARRLRSEGWRVAGTGGGEIAFEDEAAVRDAIAGATHILSSVPPAEGRDPVLARYGDTLTCAWLGYLSSTGVYGDARGAWVDESAPTGGGRRSARSEADAAWLARGARVFRLPGIYGPGRSALDRVREGKAHRLGIAGQVFSRVHVDDIVSGVIAGFGGPPGAYNLADDAPASQDDVAAFAARLIGMDPPPLVTLDDLSPAGRGFYAENRRVSNLKAKRMLGWTPRYTDYRAGLRSISAMTSPISARRAPKADSVDQ